MGIMYEHALDPSTALQNEELHIQFNSVLTTVYTACSQQQPSQGGSYYKLKTLQC